MSALNPLLNLNEYVVVYWVCTHQYVYQLIETVLVLEAQQHEHARLLAGRRGRLFRLQFAEWMDEDV